jgi:hypothetical protein
MPAEERVCAAPGCGERFVPKRSTARYHSATCRQRAARQRKAAEHNETEEAKTGTRDEHDLVKAVRLELEKAGRLMTVNGQLALQLARRAANPEESGLVGLSKELDARMTAALADSKQPETGGAGADSDGDPADEEDEVTRARRQREEARQAAGLS